VSTADVGGNVYDKYGTRNPVARRLMAGFMSDLDQLVARTAARQAHEVGCGEGELSIRLAQRGIRMRGTDAFPEVLEEARRRAAAAGVEVEFDAVPVEELDPDRDAAQLVVCCEVLEQTTSWAASRSGSSSSTGTASNSTSTPAAAARQIGRASCRERV